MKDIVHETLLYHYNQAVDDLVCAKENHDYYWGAWLDCDADTPDNQYNHIEKMVAYWHREMVRRTQEYKSFKTELEWIEFFDADHRISFRDFTNTEKILVANVTAQMESHRYLAVGYFNSHQYSVAKLHANKAADLEWMLFQEVN